MEFVPRKNTHTRTWAQVKGLKRFPLNHDNIQYLTRIEERSSRPPRLHVHYVEEQRQQHKGETGQCGHIGQRPRNEVHDVIPNFFFFKNNAFVCFLIILYFLILRPLLKRKITTSDNWAANLKTHSMVCCLLNDLLNCAYASVSNN